MRKLEFKQEKATQAKFAGRCLTFNSTATKQFGLNAYTYVEIWVDEPTFMIYLNFCNTPSNPKLLITRYSVKFACAELFKIFPHLNNRRYTPTQGAEPYQVVIDVSD